MDVQKRKAKEKTELKRLILNGAKKLFNSRGIEQTTIKNIAEEIEYSIGTVYLYYKDKAEILHELRKHGFVRLYRLFRESLTIQDPVERCWSIGLTYLDLAFKNPDLYELMFTKCSSLEFTKSIQDNKSYQGSAAFIIVKQTLKECQSIGYFEEKDTESISFFLWGSVHGMSSLYISKRLRGFIKSDTETFVKRAYADFMSAIGMKFFTNN